jgi:aspartate carbamoyltransferase catalytic subunit
MIKHFLSLSNFSTQDLSSLIDRAQFFFQQNSKPDETHAVLKDKIISNLFYEPSTRTRCSFEIAAKKLGAHVINLQPENSSVKKGETVYDTLKTFEALGSDGIILRHQDDHVFEELRSKISVPLINAGAGKFEHPSQGLLDLLTLKQEFGKLEGLKIAVCGDIKHSRVAGSLMVAAEKFGMEIFLCGPETLLPKRTEKYLHSANLDDVLPKIDAIMMLRIQLERHESLELDSKTYHEQFGLNLKRVKIMKKNAIIMHPGPFNRGIELSDEVVEHHQSRIFKQVSNGVFSRMAILEWALRGIK